MQSVILITSLFILLFSSVSTYQQDYQLENLNINDWRQFVRNASSQLPFSPEHAAWIAEIQRALPNFYDGIQISDGSVKKISPECAEHMVMYNDGIGNASLWAMTMFDASGKFPESLLSGAFAFLGNMDQCLTMTKETFGTPFSSIETGVIIYIQSLKPNSDFSIYFVLGSCMPETCTSNDIKEIYRDVILGPLLSVFAVPLVIVTDDMRFTGHDMPPLDASAITVIVVYSMLAFLVVIATIFELFKKKQRLIKGKIAYILLSFSAYRNMKTLMSMKKSPSSISCLHGLRVLSLFWIMLGHSYSNTGVRLLINAKETAKVFDHNINAILYNIYIAVDSFFYLSGFLMCYAFINDMNKKKSFNIFKFYIYRYLRLTPTLALIVAFFAGLFPFIGYGPTWRYVIYPASDVCKKYWWLTLIYLNNYIRLDPKKTSLCLDQSWYLSVDMQLAWLSPIALFPLWKWPKKTCQFLLPVLILASCLAPFISTIINEFPMIVNIWIEPSKQRSYALEIYQTVHMRATPYVVGIAAAYFMIKIKNIKIEMKWWMVTCGWLLSTGFALIVLFVPSIMHEPNYVYEPVGAAFYAGFHRLAWSLSLTWIVFACTRGFGGIVNHILSWKGWLPLSRLSYCVFLTHLTLIYYKLGNLRVNEYFSLFGAIHDFFAEIMFTILTLGIILYLLCEAPTLNLLKILFKKSSSVVSIPKQSE